MEAGPEGDPKHHAAVLPASSNEIKDIEANAADECPDGKERRPPRISWAFLK